MFCCVPDSTDRWLPLALDFRGAPQFFLLNVSLPKVHIAKPVMEFQVCECNISLVCEYSTGIHGGKTHFCLPLPFRLSLQVWVLNFCLPQNFRLTICTEFSSTTDFPSTTEFSSNHELWSNPQLFIFSSSNTEFWSNHELRSTPELVSNTEFLSNTEISSFTEFSSTNFRFIKGFVSSFDLLRQLNLLL